MREYHVRICEGLGVKFPGSTRQFLTKSDVRKRAISPLGNITGMSSRVPPKSRTLALLNSILSR